MSKPSHSVFKHNQTGYCKYKDACNKVHEGRICQNSNKCIRKDFIRRHPKICKPFSKEEGCTFKNDCSYLHDIDKKKIFIKKKVTIQCKLLWQNITMKSWLFKTNLKIKRHNWNYEGWKCVFLRNMHKKFWKVIALRFRKN